LSSFLHHFNSMFKWIEFKNVAIIFISNLLDLYWISISGQELLIRCKCKIFKSMNLTETPEHFICILTSSLYSENLWNIIFLQGLQHYLIHHISLSQWLCWVKWEIVGKIFSWIWHFIAFKQSKFPNYVLWRCVVCMINSFKLMISKLWEKFAW